MRALWARVTPADQDKLLWAPHLIDWREYWLDTHFPGLQKWTFDKLDEEFGAKPKSVYTYKELVELFEATTKLHRNRTALRLVRKDDDAEPITYTYGQIGEMAWQGAGVLRQLGIGAGDRVVLMSENRPEWGISYFAILLAGATVVPLDKDLTLAEVAEPREGVARARRSCCRARSPSGSPARRSSRCRSATARTIDRRRVALWSPAHPALGGWFAQQPGCEGARVLAFDELLDRARRLGRRGPPRRQGRRRSRR